MSQVEVRGSGYGLLVQLEQAGVVTPLGLDLELADFSWDQYEAFLYMVGHVRDTSSWVVGDAINWGEKRWGETYVQAVEETGLSPQTCMNIASVCRRVPMERRVPTLKFGHHEAVASLPPNEQTQWLREAQKQGWSRSALRAAIKGLPPAVETEEETMLDVVRLLLNTAEPYGDRFLVERETFQRLQGMLEQ